MIALVAGIVLGAWQPRGELLAMRTELDALKATAARPCRGGAADSIRSILRADAPNFEAAVEGKRSRPADDAPSTEPPGSDAPDDADAPPVAPPTETPEQMRDAMNTALDARRAQALAALVEQGGLEDDEVAAVTDAMDQMNRELKVEVDAFVDAAVAAGEVDRRDIMDFAAESLDIVIAADDRMRKAVPDDVYAEVDEAAVDPFSYVSGDVLASLMKMEGVTAPTFGE